jgi:DNA-binding PadR family transcriptional regulator
MTRESLGEFEQIVLLAIIHLGEQRDADVYGVPIVDEIARRTGRQVADAAVYVTLRRLEQKGLVEAWKSDPTPERGGKARRCVRVTPHGRTLLSESRTALERMWQGLDARARRVR